MTEARALVLQRPTRGAIVRLGLLVVALPVATTALALQLIPQDADHGPLAVSCLVLAISLLVWIALAVLAASSDLHVGRDGLWLRAAMYRVRLVRPEILTYQIRILEGSTGDEDSPVLRTNGIAFGSFQVGWFRSRSGRKLFVVRGGATGVIVPTTRGFALLLGASDAASFAAELQARLG